MLEKPKKSNKSRFSLDVGKEITFSIEVGVLISKRFVERSIGTDSDLGVCLIKDK